MERVLLAPHSPQWKQLFVKEERCIRAALLDVVVDVHHMGSTAVQDICAKPVVDILLSVRNIDELDAYDDAMRMLDYEVMGEFGIRGRRYYRKDNANGDRTHHVHAFASHSPEIARHLNFRDFLRTHRQYALEYEAVKLRLATLHPHDREQYTEGKTECIQGIEMKAARWKGEVATKACAVVLRESERGTEVLVFMHPSKGIQFVKGTIETGESSADAALRELVEESGITSARILRSMGTWYSDVNNHIWEFFEVLAQQTLPDTWQHVTNDGEGHVFDYRWHLLADAPTAEWHRPYRMALEYIRRNVIPTRSTEDVVHARPMDDPTL